MSKRLSNLAVFTLLAAAAASGLAAQSTSVTAAIAWYDTLGFPDVAGLPYVRVATGKWRQEGTGPRENVFVHGFLVREDVESFTVFLCSVSNFTFREDYPPFAPLRTMRFVRKESGPAHEQVRYEIEDFRQVASAVLARVRERVADAQRALPDGYPYPVSHRVRIFTFGLAALRQGLPDVGVPLMNIAAAIPVGQTGRVEPERLRDLLQQQIGDAVLVEAELNAQNPEVSWTELLRSYDGFEQRFRASTRIGYARAAADTLRQMIAEDAVHVSKPLEDMSPSEQAAANIYQFRSLTLTPPHWLSSGPYPVDFERRDGKDWPTPVHRLIDLGHSAVPQLIAALDDQSFTRTAVASFNGTDAPKTMRVSDFARNILSFVSGRNFSAWRAPDGTPIPGTVRQRAEAWWAEIQGKGDRQQLIDDTAAGGPAGLDAARKLVARYPEVAVEAIESGVRNTSDAGLRGEYVKLAARLPGDTPVSFLRSELTGQGGFHARVQAARGLFTRGQPDAVPAMIDSWRNLIPRLSGVGPNNQAPYFEAGLLIAFLATSGDVRAIEALGEHAQQTPVDVRVAIVQAFLPRPKNGGGSTTGPTVSAWIEPDWDSAPSADAALVIERLLLAALTDREPRVGMRGTYDDVTFEDPRVADMAVLALSKRWPAKYSFRWSANVAERDAQIEKIRSGGSSVVREEG